MKKVNDKPVKQNAFSGLNITNKVSKKQPAKKEENSLMREEVQVKINADKPVISEEKIKTERQLIKLTIDKDPFIPVKMYERPIPKDIVYRLSDFKQFHKTIKPQGKDRIKVQPLEFLPGTHRPGVAIKTYWPIECTKLEDMMFNWFMLEILDLMSGTLYYIKNDKWSTTFQTTTEVEKVTGVMKYEDINPFLQPFVSQNGHGLPLKAAEYVNFSGDLGLLALITSNAGAVPVYGDQPEFLDALFKSREIRMLNGCPIVILPFNKNDWVPTSQQRLKMKEGDLVSVVGLVYWPTLFDSTFQKSKTVGYEVVYDTQLPIEHHVYDLAVLALSRTQIKELKSTEYLGLRNKLMPNIHMIYFSTMLLSVRTLFSSFYLNPQKEVLITLFAIFQSLGFIGAFDMDSLIRFVSIAKFNNVPCDQVWNYFVHWIYAGETDIAPGVLDVIQTNYQGPVVLRQEWKKTKNLKFEKVKQDATDKIVHKDNSYFKKDVVPSNFAKTQPKFEKKQAPPKQPKTEEEIAKIRLEKKQKQKAKRKAGFQRLKDAAAKGDKSAMDKLQKRQGTRLKHKREKKDAPKDTEIKEESKNAK